LKFPYRFDYSLAFFDANESQIDGGSRFGGDDVRQHSASNYSDVERSAALEIVHRVDGQNLISHLRYGADSSARIVARMSRATANYQLELANALAPGLDDASGDGRLKHKGGPCATAFFLDHIARKVAAGFFIAGQKKRHRPGSAEIEFSDRPQSECRNGDSRFHIEYAGSERAVFFHSERALGERSQGPYGVEVAHDEQLLLVSLRAVEARAQYRAAARLADDFHVCAELRKPLAEVFGYA
jgi:hypothetical protein